MTNVWKLQLETVGVGQQTQQSMPSARMNRGRNHHVPQHTFVSSGHHRLPSRPPSLCTAPSQLRPLSRVSARRQDAAYIHASAIDSSPGSAGDGEPIIVAPVKLQKDISGIDPVCAFRSFEELSARLLEVPLSSLGPSNVGTLSMIVQRPGVNKRFVVDSAPVTISGGVEGSGWKERYNETKNPGYIDQVCVMPTACIRAVAGDENAAVLWPPAGDQLFMDYNLASLFVGDRVRVGEQVVLQMTKKPHNGCLKFAARYGPDSLRVMNSPEGKRRRLRGIYFNVVTDGVLRTGDRIAKVASDSV
jgi:MOSC domain-containing protein YiiM